MNEQDLKFVADALLALCNEESPKIYNDEQLAQRARANQEQDLSWTLLGAGRDCDALGYRECSTIVHRAKLTARQDQIIQHRINGCSFEQIGTKLGTSKQSVQTAFISAIKKIRRACRVYPYRGLSDVYRWEVRRGASYR